MRYKLGAILLLLFFTFFGCQKARKIGGRVLEDATNKPVPNAVLAIGSTDGSGNTAFVTTNSSGYYVFKPNNASSDYFINLVNLQQTGLVGSDPLLPIQQFSRASDNNREYDFHVLMKKRLTINFLDTISLPTKTYTKFTGYITTKNQALDGFPIELQPAGTVMDTFQVYTFSKVGWNYISGYVTTSDNQIESFEDSILVSRPLDGIDEITIYF